MATTQQQQAEILTMYDAGIRDMNEFVTNTDLSEAAVRKILKDFGRIQSSTHTEKDTQAICDAYTSDMPVKEILRTWHLKPNTLYALLLKKNIPIRLHSKAAQGLRETQMQRAVNMYKGGSRISDITGETGVALVRLYDELEKQGVPRRSSPPEKAANITRALDMYQKGESLAAIFEITDVSPTVLYKQLTLRRIPRRSSIATENRLDEAVKLYTKGVVVDVINNTTKVSPTALYRTLRRRGINLRRYGGTHPPEKLDEAVEMYRKGHTLGLIYDKTKVPSKTLYQELTNRGLEQRP